MANITIKCKCGNVITVNVKTIDKLKLEIIDLKRQRDNYKARLTAFEMKSKSNPFSDLFR